MNAPQASKVARCPSTCKRPMLFTINAGAWCCEGCGWVKEFTKAEAKKFAAAKPARSVVITPGINDLATLRADLADLKRSPHLYPSEIRECEAEIARQEAEPAPASALVEEIKAGEFVKRKADANKVYRRGGYDRASQRYALIDCDDISRAIYVRKGTRLFIGFTY